MSKHRGDVLPLAERCALALRHGWIETTLTAGDARDILAARKWLNVDALSDEQIEKASYYGIDLPMRADWFRTVMRELVRQQRETP